MAYKYRIKRESACGEPECRTTHEGADLDFEGDENGGDLILRDKEGEVTAVIPTEEALEVDRSWRLF